MGFVFEKHEFCDVFHVNFEALFLSTLYNFENFLVLEIKDSYLINIGAKNRFSQLNTKNNIETFLRPSICQKIQKISNILKTIRNFNMVVSSKLL